MRMGLLVAFLLGSVAASAQAQVPEEDRVVYSKRTVITLDGHTIEGGLDGPRMTTIDVRPPSRFGNIIRIRRNFRVELLGSGADL